MSVSDAQKRLTIDFNPDNTVFINICQPYIKFCMKIRSVFPCILSLCGVMILLSGCFGNQEQQGNPQAKKVHTLVFIDKTLSVRSNTDYVDQKYKKELTEIVNTNLQNTGDKLEIYFVHENTSRARALSLEVRSEKDDTYGASATDREMIENTYQLMLQKEKNVFLRQALSKLDQSNTGISNQRTDLWASLPVIENASRENGQVKVYYFSDMVESTKGEGRRDFHVQPPSSQQQAAQWAEEDIKQLSQYAIGRPEVTIISPFEPLASSRENNPHVAYYWQLIFQELAGVNISEI